MGNVVFYVKKKKKNTIANGNMTQEEMFTDEVSFSSLIHITFSLIWPTSFLILGPSSRHFNSR